MGAESVTLQWLEIDEHLPDSNLSYRDAAFCQFCSTHQKRNIILLQGQLPSGLPADFTCSNARLELDLYYSGSTGSGILKWLYRGLNQTGSTWNLQNKNTGAHWLSGGPFNVGIDLGALYWSGALTDDDPQTIIGNAALNALIESKGAGGWVSFGIYVAAINGGTKFIDGARLKFDWVAAGTPVLTGFSPSGMVAGATPVLTVTGADLDAGALTAITLVGGSNYNLTSIALDSATQIHGTVPGGVAVGSYSVRATIGGSNYTAPGSFVVSSATPTLSNCRGDDGGVDFVHHKRRTLTCTGTSLTGTSSITLLGQENQGDTSLASITNVSSTEVSGWLLGPIPPGRYQVGVVCSAGTVYREVDVSLGPAWW